MSKSKFGVEVGDTVRITTESVYVYEEYELLDETFEVKRFGGSTVVVDVEASSKVPDKVTIALYEEEFELVSEPESESTMFESFAFPIESESEGEFLQEYFEDIGVKLDHSFRKDHNWAVFPRKNFCNPEVNSEGRGITQNCDPKHKLDKRPYLTDLRAMVKGEYEWESAPTFADRKLNGYSLDYNPETDNLHVGCNTFDATEVLSIADKLQEIREYHDNN